MSTIALPGVDAAVRALREAQARFSEVPADAPEAFLEAVILELRAAELRCGALLAEARGRSIA